MKGVACFDIGTTDIKGVLIDKKGGVYGAISVPVNTYTLGGGRIDRMRMNGGPAYRIFAPSGRPVHFMH